MEQLDRDRIEKLTAAILAPIKENYQAGPISQDRAFEALNALAVAVGVVLQGCDDPKAGKFFNQALESNKTPFERN